MTSIPLYELYQKDGQELDILKAHIHEVKPFSRIIEELSGTQLSDAEKQQVLQAMFRTEATDGILDVIEQLLATASYLGLDSDFCVFLITEAMYFILQMNLEPMYVSRYENHTKKYSFKACPGFPFLHQCLQKDPLFQTKGHLRNKQKGQFLVKTSIHLDDISNAIEAGNLRFLQYLQPIRFTPELCQSAAWHGQLHILKWLREQGCPWSNAVTHASVSRGHLHVLKWASEQGCPWYERLYENAARTGNLDLLKCLRDQGCPWDIFDFTCDIASAYGYLGILKWAIQHGCPWDKISVSYRASAHGHSHILDWLHDSFP